MGSFTHFLRFASLMLTVLTLPVVAGDEVKATYRIHGIVPGELAGKAKEIKLDFFRSDTDRLTEKPISATAVLSDQGAFEYVLQDVTQAKRGYQVQIRVQADDFAPCMGWAFCKETAVAEAKFQAPYAASEAIRYTGKIVDLESRQPIAYMSLYLDMQGTVLGRSDAEGRFDISLREGHSDFTVWSEGWCGQTYSHPAAKAGESYDIVIYKEHGVSMKIKVVDSDGQPVANAKVQWWAAGARRGQTDAVGLITLTNLSAFRPGTLVVSADSFAELSLETLYAAEYSVNPLVVTLAAQ